MRAARAVLNIALLGLPLIFDVLRDVWRGRRPRRIIRRMERDGALLTPADKARIYAEYS